MNNIINLFNQYGYFVLLISLTLELIAFPLPGEALMTYCGYVVYMKKMSWPISIMVASAGVITGITMSYLIGKILGVKFFEKHGHYVHLGKNRIDKVSVWFQNYGSRLLIAAYFIPGVRHVTGYFSGITRISYRKFAVSAYTGAFIWTFTFITLGKLLGADWDKYHVLMTKYMMILGIIAAVIMCGLYIYRNYRQKIKEGVINILKNGLKLFHSLGKVKVLVAGAAALFLVFSILITGIIQDYLANEFGQFDKITRYLIFSAFDENWSSFMKVLYCFSNNYILLIAAALTIILAAFKEINRLHEIKFITMSFLGAELLSFALKNVFRRIGPSGLVYTFPSSKILIPSVIYGFLVYILIKQIKRKWIRSIIIGVYLCLCSLIALSLVYLNIQYPSDAAAGFEFGIVWLSLSIILMEVGTVLNNFK